MQQYDFGFIPFHRNLFLAEDVVVKFYKLYVDLISTYFENVTW